MHYEDDTLVGMTIGELLDNNKIEYDKWYWVQEDPYIDITGLILHDGHPLYERHKARVVDMRYYIENQKSSSIHGLFKVKSFVGYRFVETGPLNDKAPSLDRVVVITRSLLPVTLDESTIQTMKLGDRPEGSYFFKQTASGITELNYDDLYFLRRYYQIDISLDATGVKTEIIQESSTTRIGYTIFEYYNSGALQQTTQIGATLVTEKSEKKEYPHGYKVVFRTTQYKDDFKMPSRLSTPSKPQTVTDVGHPYWIPNILNN